MQRTFRITVFIILFAIAGVIVSLIGVSYWKQGADGFNSVNTDLDPALIRSWFPYFQTFMWAGALFVIGGLGYIASAWFLWQRSELGKKIGLYSGAAIVLAWGILEYVSFSFQLSPPISSLLIGLVALYLLTGEIREYCSE